MKTINSIIIVFLFVAIRLIHATNHKGNSLEVKRPLIDATYVRKGKVQISCSVKRARTYFWYKDGKLIDRSNSSFTLKAKGRKLLIKQFSEKFAGVYECEGRDKEGRSGKTRAKLDFVSPCKQPQANSMTKCFDELDQYSCGNLTSFPPSADEFKVKIKLKDDEIDPEWIHVWLEVIWNVPTKGADRIWGWQIRTFNVDDNLLADFGERRCYQVNVEKRKYAQIDANSIITERYAVPVSRGDHEVRVSSLPISITPDVKITIKAPSLCDIGRRSQACCESYVNTSLVVSNNKTILKWTTYYDESSNVDIKGFVITWFSGPSRICDYKSVTLDSMQSNYTIAGLQSSGCGNYTIMLKVKFENHKDLGCNVSKPEELLFILPPEPTRARRTITRIEKSSSGAMATAGFAVAAILGGIVIIGLVYLWIRRKKPKPGTETLGMETGKIQDYQLSSTSFIKEYPPQEGRLHGDACWSAGGNDKNQWIQVDLCKEKDITAIATQGRKDADQWVQSYVVSYSTDGNEYQCYQDDGVSKLFEGNTDKNTVQMNALSLPITARYIRIHPQSWFDHISMRIELYGLSGSSQKGVKVLILNPHHCELCTGVVHALGTLLIGTGRIRCEVDIFTPVRHMCDGLASWTQNMILNSDHVIIPWLCKVNPPNQDSTVNDLKRLIFRSSLQIVEAELVTQNKRNKFIPVCLDDCLLEALPANLTLLPTYNIPSQIDDLVINLLGKTRLRPDTKWPIVEFEDQDYRVARSNLQEAVNKMKKDHPRF